MAGAAKAWVAAVAVFLSNAIVRAGSFESIGANYQFYSRGLSADKSTLIGSGLVLPLGNRELGMTYTAAGGLSYLPDPGAAYQYNIPTDVSGNGSVLVGFNEDSSNDRYAWQYTAATGYQSLVPAGDVTSSVASQVSTDGNTVAGSFTNGSTPSAFVWTRTGGATVLPVPSYNSLLLSADGSTVASTTVNSAYTWTAAGGVKYLNPLPGIYNVVPDVISPDGSRLFGTATDTSNNYFVFKYVGGAMTSLGSPNFYNNASGTGVGVDGGTTDGSELVGVQLYFDPTTQLSETTNWVWTQTGGYESLQDYLTANGVSLGTYQISTITGISADGTTLYGTGLDDGIQPSGWIVVVPEPASATVFCVVAAIHTCCRRRSNG